MSPHPEFSRRIQTRSLGPVRPGEPGHEMVVDATAAECRSLAARLDVPQVESLSCRFRLSGLDKTGSIAADGLLQARLSRICVTTLEDFPTTVTEQFTVRFVPDDRASEGSDDALDLEADDDIPYVNGVIDLGEAAVEQLALALDPYPRKPGAERPAGVRVGDPPSATDEEPVDPDDADERPNPFAALARMRRTDG